MIKLNLNKIKNMNMTDDTNYEMKYLKYRNKYFDLREKLNK